LCLLLDVSASMDDEGRLENVKHSLHHLLGLLTPTDRVSLVTFSSRATTVLRQAFLTDVEALRVTLSCIRTESNTNLSAGLVEARQSLFRDPGQTQCVLLLTDGFATSGETNADALLALAEPLTESSVLHVIGYGEGHQADLLSRMATVGGGSYHMVCNKEDVAVVIGDVVGGLVSCAFQQVTLTIPVC
jgi:Ca-activated chloride channel family protein